MADQESKLLLFTSLLIAGFTFGLWKQSGWATVFMITVAMVVFQIVNIFKDSR